MMRVIWKGEDVGHPFRGNQYTNVGGRLVATHRKVGKPILGPDDPDKNSYGTDRVLDEARPIYENLKSEGQLMSYQTLENSVMNHDLRSQMKADICRELSKRTGYREDEISDILHEWAYDSNGRGSLMFQQAIADEFGLPLSSYQKQKIKQNDAQVERGYYYYNRNRKVARAMYEYTQEKLADGPKYITLYRGIGVTSHNAEWFSNARQAMRSSFGDAITSQYRGNAIESWSSNHNVAASFGGKAVLAMNVPREAIFATSFSGLGCLNEYEFVIFGNPSGRPHTVGINTEDIYYY